MSRPRIAFYALDLSNTFNERLLTGVLEGAEERGADISVIHGGQWKGPHDFEGGRNGLYHLCPPDLWDGVLVPPIFSFLSPDEQLAVVSRWPRVPLVTLGHRLGEHPRVLVDNKPGFRELIHHLIRAKGRRQIGIITGPPRHPDSQERFEALREAFEENGLRVDPAWIYEGTFGRSTGAEGARQLYECHGSQLEALVCFNDNMALGALEALSALGLRVPRDLLLTGFDNSEEGRNQSPPLTTLDYPMYQLGRESLHLLMDQLEGRTWSEEVVLGTVFLPRRSTADDDRPFSRSQAVHASDTALFQHRDLLKDSFLQGSLSLWQGPHEQVGPEALRSDLEQIFDWAALQSLAGPDRDPEPLLLLFQERWEQGQDLSPWLLALEALKEILAPYAVDESHLRRSLRTLAEAVQQKLNIDFTQQRIRDREDMTRLLMVGEELTTSLDLTAIQAVLDRRLAEFGITQAVVARFRSSSSYPVLTYARDWPGVLPPPGRAVATASLFGRKGPGGHWLIDSLQVQDELFGVLAFNLVPRPGLVSKSLRHTLSSSLFLSDLWTEIQQQNISLEERVRERTQALEEANRRLKEEMDQRARAETELLKQRNLESLGLLAGGLAHDFNNLLTAVLGNLNLLELKLSEEERQHCLHDMEQATLSARDLTQQLLTFAKGGAPVKSRCRLDQLVMDTLRFLLRGSAVQASWELPAAWGEVEADPAQLSQVIQNLILNALQAMPKGGTLSVRGWTWPADRDPPAGLSRGPYLALEFHDQGPGIRPEDLVRIFDPYFTTKAKGNGLGLATSLGIIKRHGGTIEVDSRYGEGATFRILLPAGGAGSRPAEEARPAEVLPPPDPLKLLVLEDQPALQRLLVRTLESLGHQVTLVSRGEEALKLLDAGQIPDFDGALFDLIIPGGLGGRETLAQILERHPQFRAYAMSGYSETTDFGKIAEAGFLGLLKKPFQRMELNAVLGRLASQRPRAKGPDQRPTAP